MDTIFMNRLRFVVPPSVSSKQMLEKLAEENGWTEPQPVCQDPHWWYEPLTNSIIIPTSAQQRIDLVLKSMPVKAVLLGHEIVDQEVETIPDVEPLPWVVAPDPETSPTREPLPWVLPDPEKQPMRGPTPWVLPEPKKPSPEFVPWTIPEPNIEPIIRPLREVDWEHVGHVAWEVTKATGKVVGIVLLGGLVVMAALGGGVAGCFSDPSVVIVTEEGEWFEIFRYYS